MYRVQTFSPLALGKRSTRTYYNPTGNDEADELFGSRDQAREFAGYLADHRSDVSYAIVWERRGKKWGTCFDTRHGY